MIDNETEKRLAGIETRCNAATPGPWTSDLICHCHVYGEKLNKICSGAHGEDSRFIAHARSDVPYLLALVRREAERAERYAALLRDGIARADSDESVKVEYGEFWAPRAAAALAEDSAREVEP